MPETNSSLLAYVAECRAAYRSLNDAEGDTAIEAASVFSELAYRDLLTAPLATVEDVRLKLKILCEQFEGGTVPVEDLAAILEQWRSVSAEL